VAVENERLKKAHLNSMQACDGDAERTIRRAGTRRPTLDHNMVYVAGESLGIGRLGSDGFWMRDYGGEVRVGRPFGAR